MKEKEIIKFCIEAVAQQRGIMDARAEREARADRYVAAGEYQTLAKGIGMAMDILEELKREAK